MKHLVHALALLGASALAPFAHATLLTYTESSVASGTLGGQAFTDALITISATGNSSTVAFNGSAFYTILPASLFVTGLGTTSFTDVIQFVSNESNAVAGVGDNTVNRAVLFTYSPVFSTYNLQSALGPVIGTAAINYGTAFGTALGSFILTDSSSSTFSATTPSATTPEPSTLLLFGTGLLGLTALLSRRNKNA